VSGSGGVDREANSPARAEGGASPAPGNKIEVCASFLPSFPIFHIREIPQKSFFGIHLISVIGRFSRR